MVDRRALAGIVAVGILLAGCSAQGAPSPTASGAAGVAVLSLAVGDCLDTTESRRVSATVPVVDCAAEHDGEAYAEVTLDDGRFPGASEVKTAAEAGCVAAFAGFVGTDYDSSTLDYAYYFPTKGSWDRGDRRILCIVVDPGARVTGSLRGAAR